MMLTLIEQPQTLLYKLCMYWPTNPPNTLSGGTASSHFTDEEAEAEKLPQGHTAVSSRPKIRTQVRTTAGPTHPISQHGFPGPWSIPDFAQHCSASGVETQFLSPQWLQKDELTGFAEGAPYCCLFTSLSERQGGLVVRTCALKPHGSGSNPTSAIYCCVSLGKLPTFSVPPFP